MQRLVVGILLLSFSASATATAGTFNVSPIQIELPPNGGAGVLRVENRGGAPTLVMVELSEWDAQSEADSATADVLAFPPLFELAPGALQVVRLALRKPFMGDIEKVYRLALREVPREIVSTDGTDANSVSFALNLNLPVFLTPQGAEPIPVWSLRSSGKASELVLANVGNSSLRLRAVKLFGEAAEPIFASEQRAYVLAGEEKSWPLDLKGHSLDGPLTIKAETRGGTLEALVALEGN